jgi:hypothetical protein
MADAKFDPETPLAIRESTQSTFEEVGDAAVAGFGESGPYFENGKRLNYKSLKIEHFIKCLEFFDIAMSYETLFIRTELETKDIGLVGLNKSKDAYLISKCGRKTSLCRILIRILRKLLTLPKPTLKAEVREIEPCEREEFSINFQVTHQQDKFPDIFLRHCLWIRYGQIEAKFDKGVFQRSLECLKKLANDKIVFTDGNREKGYEIFDGNQLLAAQNSVENTLEDLCAFLISGVYSLMRNMRSEDYWNKKFLEN